MNMVNQESFLPVSTIEEPQHQGFSVPNYSPIGTNGNFVESLSVDAGGVNGFPSNEIAIDIDNYGRHLICCNCCCDFRHAVLVVNGISITLKLMIMLGIVLGGSYVEENLDDIESDIQDDDAREKMDSFVKGGGMALHEEFLEAFETISIVLHVCGIYGALCFKKWGILTAGAGYVIQILLGMSILDFWSIALGVAFLYPHYFMHKLMVEGVMTESNYHKLTRCCGDRKM